MRVVRNAALRADAREEGNLMEGRAARTQDQR